MKSRLIDCKEVKIADGFWKERQKINSTATVSAVYDRFDETGRIKGFECNWKSEELDGRAPHRFWDSDVAKWIEGAAYILMHEDRPELEAKIDSIVDAIERNMTVDGYYNMHYIQFGYAQRFTNRDGHELYCAGHHFEAAVAYHTATGKDKYLRLCERFADLIYRVFITEKSAFFETPGHPEVELALIKLYRKTKNPKHLELCKYFIDKRGDNEKDVPLFNDSQYAMDTYPIRKASTADGHSVRANYLMSGACDLAHETDDRELAAACERVFDNATTKRMFITGSQGSTYVGERYTTDYHLSNKSAYGETCAALSMAMYASRMGLLELDSKYDDVCERALLNGSLAGVSLDGSSFFYENPLELRDEDYAFDVKDFFYKPHTAPRTRQRVFNCSCCPPNILRVIAGIGEYAYSYAQESDTFIVRQFISSDYSDGGMSVSLRTEFPKNGKISITASGMKKLAVRIPYYSKDFTANLPYETLRGYAIFDISGTVNVEIDLCLRPRLVFANTRLYDNIRSAAVMYGPLVYCAESVDNGCVHNFVLDKKAPLEMCDEIGGVPTITAHGKKLTLENELYSDNEPVDTPASLKLIPFFAFANRGEAEMLTFLHAE